MMARRHALPHSVPAALDGDVYAGLDPVLEVLTFAVLPTVPFVDEPTAAQPWPFVVVRGIGNARRAASLELALKDGRMDTPHCFGRIREGGARNHRSTI